MLPPLVAGAVVASNCLSPFPPPSSSSSLLRSAPLPTTRLTSFTATVTIEVGSKIPDVAIGFVSFPFPQSSRWLTPSFRSYVPYSDALEDASVCGLPSKIQTHKDWAGKKVVVFGIPGSCVAFLTLLRCFANPATPSYSFTKTCSENHVPPYVEKYDEFKSKGVDSIYCISSNDLFVQSAFGRVLKTGDKVVCVGDASFDFLEPTVRPFFHRLFPPSLFRTLPVSPQHLSPPLRPLLTLFLP
jgi:peroxiredoxin